MMKRRSFLALLGLAPAALALPSVALAVPEAECSPSAVNDAIRARMASIAAGWQYSAHYDAWVHTDGSAVCNKMLVAKGIASPEEYCRRYSAYPRGFAS